MPPHAIAAEATYCGTAPYGGSAVQTMDGEAILHNDTGAQKADARNHLRQYAQVIIVDRTALLHGSVYDALRQQYEHTCPNRHQRIDGQAGIALS